MTIAENARVAAAKSGFRRLVMFLAVAAAAMVVGSYFYLRSYDLATPALVATVGLAVFLSVMLGGGLMAVGFYSSDSGVDDAVAGAGVPERPVKD